MVYYFLCKENSKIEYLAAIMHLFVVFVIFIFYMVLNFINTAGKWFVMQEYFIETLPIHSRKFL